MPLKLASVFTSHMVLQRGIPAPIWGTATPGQRVSVDLLNQKVSATADTAGRWMLRLAPLEAGGPHTLRVHADDGSSLQLDDVLVGDVYLCSGQSNMEWPVSLANNAAAEIAAAQFPQIRLLQIPKVTAPSPQDSVDARWSVCSPTSVGQFSAVGFFFGREIFQTHHVPIGLINSSWGGTVAEAWTSKPALQAAPGLQGILTQLAIAERGALPKVLEEYRRNQMEWEAANFYADPGNICESQGWAKPDFNDSNWQSMSLPTTWESTGLNIDGAVWFRRSFDLPKHFAGQDLVLSLGAIDDFDVTYVNGKQVGVTDVGTMNAYAVRRKYPVPAAALVPGKNVLAVRVFDRFGAGGLVGPPEEMTIGPAGATDPVRLDGSWRFKVELALEPKVVTSPPPPTILTLENPNCPTVLFNAMIAPLVPFGLRGALWYQGESNADRAFEYRTVFPTLIQNWRNVWNESNPDQGDFAFYFVELARWKPRTDKPIESAWAELREAQAFALKLPHTGRGTIIDTGDAVDIHPTDKQTVAHRLALVARANIYGESIEYAGPTPVRHKVESGAIRISFDHVTGGLKTSDGLPLREFAIAGADRIFHWAEARIEGHDIVLHSKHVSAPVAVRYAWADNPDCNLCNGAGIPASLFRTDEWPGITQPR